MRRAGIVALFVLLSPVAAAAQPVPPVIEAARRGQAIGDLEPVGVSLAPCIPTRRDAFVRRITFRDGMWAARFSASTLGSGTWVLHVESSDGSQRYSSTIVAGVAGTYEWRTPPIYGGAVRIILEGPGDQAAVCPVVVLQQELSIHHKSTKRGLVGSDDRWTEDSPALLAANDRANILAWGQSIAHLEVMTASGGVIPCTAFFISEHVLMTAAHCMALPSEAGSSRLFVSGREIRGASLKLLSAEDIDFSLVWVADPHGAVLPIGDTASGATLLWQRPSLTEKKVSAFECATKADNGRHVVHGCDSIAGASGAPLQDRGTGAVVGLHVIGCVSDNGKPGCVNKALRIAEIRDRIKLKIAEWEPSDPVAAAEVRKAFGIQ
jgi:hypothetical protein